MVTGSSPDAPFDLLTEAEIARNPVAAVEAEMPVEAAPKTESCGKFRLKAEEFAASPAASKLSTVLTVIPAIAVGVASAFIAPLPSLTAVISLTFLNTQLARQYFKGYFDGLFRKLSRQESAFFEKSREERIADAAFIIPPAVVCAASLVPFLLDVAASGYTDAAHPVGFPAMVFAFAAACA